MAFSLAKLCMCYSLLEEETHLKKSVSCAGPIVIINSLKVPASLNNILVKWNVIDSEICQVQTIHHMYCYTDLEMHRNVVR